MKKEGYRRKTTFEKKKNGSRSGSLELWVDPLGRSGFVGLLHQPVF
jgi:hypothetical protein